MKSLINVIAIFLIFISCNKRATEVSSSIIKIRVFNFVTNNYEIFNSKKIEIKNNIHYFVYDFDKHKDTLKLFGENIYFNNQKLKKIDSEDIYVNGKYYSISKCYYEDEKNFKFDKYLFINEEIGLLFLQNLFTGNMYEYDIQKYHLMHKRIALNKLNFKSGDFEIKYNKMDYKDLNYNLNIRKTDSMDLKSVP
ncbi:hypothetical protein [Flavobacterium sp.]|uniref:hypothetical protein n=1 Tax=Flavobacterium sp. TaxID=239 RepID=UPI0025C0B560|nr:hypothetical protein [Flavobacterium sp.]